MSDKEGNKGLTNNQLEKRLLKMEGELKVAKLQKENADMRAKLEKKNAEAELAEVKAKAAKIEFELKATIQFIEMKKDKEKLEKDNEGMQKQINELKAAAGKANDGDRGVQPLLGIGNKNNNDNTNLFVAGAEDTGQVQPKEEPENNLEILEVILVPTRKVVSKVNEGDQQRQPQDKPTSSTAVTLGKKATQQPAGKLGDGLALGGGQKAKELSMVKARGQQNKLQGGGHNQQQTKDRKRHTCKECSKSFSTLSNLKQHYRTHTGEKPYKCKVCDRRFVSSSSLKVHMRIHTGVKPYECGECDRRFYLQQHLMRHIQTHTGEKPFECKSCDKRFTRADNMKQHQKKNACKPVTTDEHQGFVKQEEVGQKSWNL